MFIMLDMTSFLLGNADSIFIYYIEKHPLYYKKMIIYENFDLIQNLS
jgi:hypothetical protein